MTNKYLEKLAMNRGAKELLKHFKDPLHYSTEAVAHLGLKSVGKLSDVKGAAKHLHQMNTFGHGSHIDIDPLLQNRGRPLKDRILDRSDPYRIGMGMHVTPNLPK